MDKLADWIRRHQLAAFFLITFAITWGLGFSYGAVLKRGQFLLAPLVVVATCGPALAGIIVTAVSSAEPRRGTRKPRWIAFVIAWVVSAVVFIARTAILDRVELSPVFVVFAFVAVVPVAFVISAAYSRIPAIREYVSSLIRLRGLWGWSFLALTLGPVSVLISVPVSSILGGRPIAIDRLPDVDLTLIGLVTLAFFYQLLFFNAVGEEVGWRGFALPRLQASASPMVAALVIGLFWPPWHFFLVQAEGSPVFTLEYWVEMYISHILFSVIIVWICNRAKGSILVAGIAHAAVNTALAFIPIQDMQGMHLTWVVAALAMILVDRMWQKLPPDHPAVYRSPEHAAQHSVEPTPTPTH